MSRKRTGKTLECCNCGDDIYVPKWKIDENDNNFCSHSCHNEFQRKTIKRNCKHCGKVMERSPSRMTDFCSTECYNKKRSKEGTTEYSCDWCSKSFRVHNYRAENQENCFCSSECTSKWREQDFSGEDNPRFVDGKYKGFGNNWLAYRKRVWERADGECEWCGLSEDKNGRRLSVHHIIPRRRFIEHKKLSVEQSNFMGNLLALCMNCHQSAEFGSSFYPNNE